MKKLLCILLLATCLCTPTIMSSAWAGDDGTITINGLVWLKNATCLGWNSWWSAKNDVARLQSGMCGLSDKSTAGQWRLPTPQELASRAVNTTGFTNIKSGMYWTSLSMGEQFAYVVLFPSGYLRDYQKGNGDGYTWPVRNK